MMSARKSGFGSVGLLGLLFVMSGETSAYASDEPEVSIKKSDHVDGAEVAVPGRWMAALQSVVADFHKRHELSLACYTLYLREEAGVLKIELNPARGKDEARVRGGLMKCGPTVHYTVKESGEIVSVNYLR
jgi:hypothetical protein